MARYLREHFLADLANREGFTRMAELGLWRGRTFLHLLAHCPRLSMIGVDLWQVKDVPCDAIGYETYKGWDMINYEARVRQGAAPYGARAVILKMDTSEAALHVEDGSLDCVFIDADHTSEGVRRDIETWRPKIREGGFITGHDIDWPSVRGVVEELVPGWQAATDNVWWARA